MAKLIQSSVFGTLCIRLLAGWAILHGLLTCIGGISRWSSPVYDVVKLMPGSPYTWGIILIVGGILALTASMLGIEFEKQVFGKTITYAMMKNTGLWIIAIVCFLFSIGVLSAALQPDSTVSLAAGDRDLLICVLCVMMTKAVEPTYRK